MINQIKNYSLYVVIGIIINITTNFIESDFLYIFLKTNFITILIALLAINTTTSSVVMTKLRDLSIDNPEIFRSTLKEFKISIIEQVVIIIITVVCFTGIESKFILKFSGMIVYFKCLIYTLFSYSLYILYDTAKSIFVILEYENKE